MHLFFQSPTSSIFHFQMAFSLMHLNQLLSLLFTKNILFLMMNCPATDQFVISISFQKFSNASYILACPTIYNFSIALCSFQNAYRKFHFTETALLRIYNNLLLSINQQKVFGLVLFDLSASFDTIDQQILRDRLTLKFGIDGSAHSLLAFYLLNRFV